MPRLRRRALKQNWTDPLSAILGDSRGAERATRFIERVLIHGKGEWAGRPFLLEPFQREVVSNLFGTLKADGHRRYREALLMLPRKNGKTELCAALGLYGTFCGDVGGQVVVAANSRDQAGLLFSTACDMVEASPILRERAVVSRAKKRITDKLSRTFFQAISADASTAHGLDLSLWIYDELHEASSDELLNVLRTSTGSRAEPLGIVISTAGYDSLSPLGVLYDHAKRVLADPSIDPSFYARIYEASTEDDWTAEATWRKANPALGVFRSLDEMRAACERAKQIPAMEAAFRRLYLNQWTAAETRWLRMDDWDACGEPFDPAGLDGATAYGGLDLSTTTDLTAFVLAFPLDGEVFVRPFLFMPNDNMKERENRDRVPYSLWVKQGLITATEGNVVDYRFVIAKIKELAKRYHIAGIAFDRWGAAAVVQELEAEGLSVVQVGQGYASMSAPTKRLQELVLSRKLRHGGDAALRWNMDCLTVTTDPAGNIKPVKLDRLRSTRRIDGVVALIMALSEVVRNGMDVGQMAEFFRNPLVFD